MSAGAGLLLFKGDRRATAVVVAGARDRSRVAREEKGATNSIEQGRRQRRLHRAPEKYEESRGEET